ncbi:uncharacterized protein LAJ45_02501 [Morchella importuna]|uniref:Uncharacterized protein n=1 Tax=Morchella conica CCBAS932 TaxID=1392247 RepID=A0A3N4KWC7_9PEZI|nr:uncharacterized protein LAJ45_02501 [Morchella importuna]KAH8153688.1 hypothetical protein LAJ45_02501 [Morchella importuna]RPB14843.1 hypothetical protein P167DRAFT_46694 [Morchella conica CCBAS932]
MYHVPRDAGSPQYSYNSSYRENRRSTPSYALIPHNSNPNRRPVQYATTRYHSEPVRYRAEPRYIRYHSDPRLYGDSRDHIEYQEQRYVVPHSSSNTRRDTHTQYRTSHTGRSRETYAPARYSQYNNGQTRAYKYRSREVVDRPIPVCACVIM